MINITPLIKARTFSNLSIGALSEDTNPAYQLDPTNTYITTLSSSTHTDNLWNGEAYKLKTLLDILFYLEDEGLLSVSIRGYNYTKSNLIVDLLDRALTLSTIILDPLTDEMRNRMMVGLSVLLSATGYPTIHNKRYFFQFHVFNVLEQLARLLQWLNLYPFTYASDIVFLTGTIDSTFDAYEPDWKDNARYEEPYESEWCVVGKGKALGYVCDMSFNMHATIGCALYECYAATKELRFLKRASQIAKYIEKNVIKASDNLWYYNKEYDRTEDPDHALEVLRFVMLSQPLNLFKSSVMSELISRWFTLGMSTDKQFLKERLVVGSPSTTTLVSDVATRSVFLFEQDVDLYRKVLGV